MTNNKLAVVGERDSVMIFQAVGMEVRAINNADQAERAIHKLAREGFAVIYITEALMKQPIVREAVSRYMSVPYPAIITIPDKDGSTGMGMEGIRKNVEKAIGADILFQEGR